MMRYSRVLDKNPREIVLLKSRPCRWGRCFFCDYIDDNSDDLEDMIHLNKEILKEVTGEFKQLEVINSASVFELPERCLMDIKDLVRNKNIERLYFESHYSYRHRLKEISDFFPNTEVIFKCGIETFDNEFRNDYLVKGAIFEDFKEVKKYFNSICLMVGIKGQTKDMIRKDMDILVNNFDHGCINIYVENTTPVKRDDELIKWFRDEFGHLEKLDNIEILWNNTDFGVGD